MSLFCWTQRKIFLRKFVTRLFWGTIDFHSRKKITMEVNGAPELLCFPQSSEYLPLCSAEQRHSYRFGTTWGWVNDDRIFIFGWTIPLSAGFLIRAELQHEPKTSRMSLIIKPWRPQTHAQTCFVWRPSGTKRCSVIVIDYWSWTHDAFTACVRSHSELYCFLKVWGVSENKTKMFWLTRNKPGFS